MSLRNGVFLCLRVYILFKHFYFRCVTLRYADTNKAVAEYAADYLALGAHREKRAGKPLCQLCVQRLRQIENIRVPAALGTLLQTALYT